MVTQPQTIIAILGGAGKAGRPLVQQALTAGYRVRLLLRHPDLVNWSHERLEIIQGDARNPALMHQLLQDCQALVSTLGNPREEQLPMLSGVTRLIIQTMQQLKMSRYIVVSSYYETGKPQHDAKTKQAAEFMQQHFPLFMNDRQEEYRLLTDSDLDWTYVRLPYLVDGPPTGNIQINLDYLPSQQTTGADLAQFLISQLKDLRFIRQALFVAN